MRWGVGSHGRVTSCVDRAATRDNPCSVVQSNSKPPHPGRDPGASQQEGEPLIDETTRDALRARLGQELARLEADIAEFESTERELLSDASGENNYRDHMADQGSATYEREMDMTFEEDERLALDEVRNALARLDDGTYGTCARCSAEIPAARLGAMPTATLCITCKEAEETR